MVLVGIQTSNTQQNMYAMAASGSRRKKRTIKIARKKLPKRRPKQQVRLKKRQNKVIRKHYKKRYKKPTRKYIKRKFKPKAKRSIHRLTARERLAKTWIAWHESNFRWNIVSPAGCYGRYQLTPAYLHGDYSHANQSRTADRYVHNRYGGWIQAKYFWQVHHWY